MAGKLVGFPSNVSPLLSVQNHEIFFCCRCWWWILERRKALTWLMRHGRERMRRDFPLLLLEESTMRRCRRDLSRRLSDSGEERRAMEQEISFVKTRCGYLSDQVNCGETHTHTDTHRIKEGEEVDLGHHQLTEPWITCQLGKKRANRLNPTVGNH